MTHRELLAKIDYYLQPTIELTGDAKIRNSAIGFMKALRSVVELHKPSDPIWSDGFVVCEICNYEYHRSEPYPCSTIKAIEATLL